MKEIYLAGGCFWGLEKYLSGIPGVLETQAGYANGRSLNPTYEEVCHENTGHAETVRVRYDPERLSLKRLLELYFMAIDPTSMNRQGGDRGSQYRTGIYATDPKDLEEARRFIEQRGPEFQRPIAVEVLPLKNYAPAEAYHQKYLDKNPGGYCHISPDKFRLAREG
ncbi:peptide-methionine (S)-S-oxide reductase MsrA [Christensenellaceae bacterium NSJ-53]|uniref:Peptide methionine sulfoxide reductase MsrA n=1 Tax=Gehongia tenuis TaxID=2763655 RepID=A0A926HNQ2_9FIRM|nr:peptide-methionine (S)-S-oxide reductase MsrA [Gehongia tenuis]MBC8530854.1 peptide-methionine (S)-S-oxide reductase MsrA [Gehongia tenuis]